MGAWVLILILAMIALFVTAMLSISASSRCERCGWIEGRSDGDGEDVCSVCGKERR